MKFAIEIACPRRWNNYNPPRYQRREIDFTSLKSVAARIGTMPPTKIKKATVQEGVLSTMPIGLKFNVMEISVRSGMAYKSVSGAITRLVDAGHNIERVDRNMPAHWPAHYIYHGE